MFICTDAASGPPAARERDDATRDILAARVDDRALRYLVDVHPAFEGFRTAASQLAGLLILAAAGARSGEPDLALLNAARLTYAEARDKFLGLAVSEPVRHIHRHLREAADGLGATFAEVESGGRATRGPFDGARALAVLKAAYRHLQHVSRLTPGFRLVDTRDSCCGCAG
jgi:hypothetical protein